MDSRRLVEWNVDSLFLVLCQVPTESVNQQNSQAELVIFALLVRFTTRSIAARFQWRHLHTTTCVWEVREEMWQNILSHFALSPESESGGFFRLYHTRLICWLMALYCGECLKNTFNPIWIFMKSSVTRWWHLCYRGSPWVDTGLGSTS